MDRDRYAGDDLLRRAAMGYLFEGGGRGHDDRRSPRPQQVPVNVFDTGEDVVVVAPMPGVEADNIDIQVLGTRLSLRAEMRGPDQMKRQYLVHEWTYGPYERVLELPSEVDAGHANASHNNGVLVLTLPKAQRPRSVKVRLNQQTSTEATQRGHSGHHTTRQGLEGE